MRPPSVSGTDEAYALYLTSQGCLGLIAFACDAGASGALSYIDAIRLLGFLQIIAALRLTKSTPEA